MGRLVCTPGLTFDGLIPISFLIIAQISDQHNVNSRPLTSPYFHENFSKNRLTGKIPYNIMNQYDIAGKYSFPVPRREYFT